MRDVSSKSHSLRTAKAVASLHVKPATIEAIKSGNLPKADPVGVAKIAGIQAAKNTSLLIPYCHQVPLDFVAVNIVLQQVTIEISTEVKAIWKTGVEMEALVAASVAALTLYDMLKSVDETMEIRSIQLTTKTGGKSNMKETGNGLSAAVIVLSDSISQGKSEDRSGKLLVERLKEYHFSVGHYKVLPDDPEMLVRELIELSDKRKINLILTTGGTGISPRDITPEATQSVIERRLPAVEQTLHGYGQERVSTAMLSRGIAGTRGSTLIINLPGSSSGASDGIHALFPAIIHTFRMLKGERH